MLLRYAIFDRLSFRICSVILDIHLFFQVIEGVSVADTRTSTFASALEDCLSEALRIKADVISVVVVDGNRRHLLTSASLSYVITLLNGLETSELVRALQAAMTDEAFLINLRKRAGLQITSVSPVTITGVTTLPSPTLPPTTRPILIPSVHIDSNRSARGVGTVHAYHIKLIY